MITRKEFRKIKKCLNTDILDVMYKAGTLYIIEKVFTPAFISAKKVRSRQLECVCIIVAYAGNVDKIARTVKEVIRLIKKGE